MIKTAIDNHLSANINKWYYVDNGMLFVHKRSGVEEHKYSDFVALDGIEVKSPVARKAFKSEILLILFSFGITHNDAQMQSYSVYLL